MHTTTWLLACERHGLQIGDLHKDENDFTVSLILKEYRALLRTLYPTPNDVTFEQCFHTAFNAGIGKGYVEVERLLPYMLDLANMLYLLDGHKKV